MNIDTSIAAIKTTLFMLGHEKPTEDVIALVREMEDLAIQINYLMGCDDEHV